MEVVVFIVLVLVVIAVVNANKKPEIKFVPIISPKPSSGYAVVIAVGLALALGGDEIQSEIAGPHPAERELREGGAARYVEERHRGGRHGRGNNGQSLGGPGWKLGLECVAHRA